MPRRNLCDDEEELDSDEYDENDTSDYDDTEYEYDNDNDDEDDEDDDDEEEVLAQIDKAFRADRARIRSCEDVDELRRLRAEFVALVGSAGHTARAIRSRDLIELVDDRITDLRARRMVRRRW